MLEKLLKRKSLASFVKKNSRSRKDDGKVPSLIELLRKDTELADFFRFVKEKDFRKKACELLESRMPLN